jgi:hypothetical protein
MFQNTKNTRSPSEWPRGLRLELSSLAGTLGSWVKNPFKAWMSVCDYSVFVFCVYVGALRRADPRSKHITYFIIKIILKFNGLTG